MLFPHPVIGSFGRPPIPDLPALKVMQRAETASGAIGIPREQAGAPERLDLGWSAARASRGRIAGALRAEVGARRLRRSLLRYIFEES